MGRRCYATATVGVIRAGEIVNLIEQSPPALPFMLLVLVDERSEWMHPHELHPIDDEADRMLTPDPVPTPERP